MGKRIPLGDAKKLSENWTGKNNPRNPKSPGKAVKSAGFKDTYETWFSVEELETYLEYVKANIPDNPGIRIYFGNYGNDVGPADKSSTVFLAPTKRVDSSDSETAQNLNDYEIEPYNSGSNGNPPAEYDPKI